MSSRTLLAVLLLFGTALPHVLAQKAAEKPAAPPQDFSKEAYVIEHYSTRVTMENDGTGTRESTAVLKMLAEAGVKSYAVLNFVYSSANEVVEIDYVRVRKPDGTVVKTPDYNIQDMPGEVTRTAPLYSDIHEKHVAVKGLAVGDTLEYLIRFRTVKPEVPGQFWYEYSFTTKSIIKDERLELNVPREKYVNVVSPDFKPEVKDEGERRVYRWTHENLVVKEKDPDELPRRTLPNSHVQVTTFKSWEEVGNWYGELQKEPLKVTSAIQARAAELTRGLTTDDEKIHAIYNFVSLKFHYIGLDFGIGRYQPHAAADVLDNSYGDCKDKHTLLASLLKAAGLDAWPALINGSRKVDPDVPSPAQFNHVITVVPLGAQDIWLDTTPEVAPYRLLMPQLRDKQALVIPTNKAAVLTKTPENPPSPQNQEFSSSGKLSAEGTYSGHVEQSYRGDTEVVLRAAFRQLSESQWKDAVQRFSYAMNFGGEVSNVKVSPPDDLDKPFEISYDYVRKNFGDWEDDNTSAPLPPMGLEVTKDSREKKPLEPFFLGAPGKIVYRSRMVLPAGYSVVPRARCHETTAFAEYTGSTVFEDGVVTVNRELVLKKGEVPLSEWENFRKFGRALGDDEFAFMRLNHVGAFDMTKSDKGKSKDSDEMPDDEEVVDLTFRQGTNALQRRDFARAEELFRAVIVKDPKYKKAHFSLGMVLVAESKVSEAIAEFHREQELSPQEVSYYQGPAAYLSMTGHTEEAIEEWRRLLKAVPENPDAAFSLSILLPQIGKYSEAAEVLEAAVKTSPDNASLQLALGQVYMESKQAEKAIPHLLQAAEKKQDDPGMLNEVAYTLAENNTKLDVARKYAEKAVSELDEQAQSSESSNQAGLDVTYLLSLTWDTLGWVYFQQGDAKRAEGFIRASWQLGEESLVAKHLGEVYEKEGKTQLAAHAYEWALAVSSAPSVSAPIIGMGPQNEAMKAAQREASEITARYKKLTGKEPDLRSTRRLPNGEWTKTPAEQLRQAREVKLSNEGKISGSAQFVVVFKPGKVDSAEFASGDEDLKPLEDKLEAAHYPVEFPPDSGAILVMQINVKCAAGAACTGTLVAPVPDRSPSPVAQ